MHLRIPRPARARHAALLLAALALALPAHAAQKSTSSRKTRTTAPAPGASTAPAPASTGATYGVPLTPPPAGMVVLPASSNRSSIGIGVGAWSGFDAGKGVAVHVDYGFPRTPASWRRLELEWRLAFMFSRPTEEKDLTRTQAGVPPISIVSGVEKTTAYVIEVAPTARVRLALGQKLALFADAGVGIAQSMDTYDRAEMFVGRTIEKENVTGLVGRFGLGASLSVSERMRLLFLPLAVSVQLGPKYSAYEPTLGVAFLL